MNKQQTKLIPVVRLGEEQCDYYMDRGGIDGSEVVGNPRSTAAYDENLKSLIDAMAPLGKLGFLEEDDYYIDRYANPDFFPCVEVSKAELLQPSLVAAVHSAVSRMELEYRVDLCNAQIWLREFGIFNVFIEHDRILVFAEDPRVVSHLGLDKPSFEVPITSS